MSAETKSPVQPGEVIAGKYRVERVLTAGGMGVVVVAMHLELHELVCLKFILAHMTTTENVDRFLREARSAAKLKGEHVCHVMDVGRLDDGAPYIVMEFLEGDDLAGILKRRGPLPIDEVCGLVAQACDGLAEAHDAGIVHRDIKPANLFVVTRGNVVKVLDFGISKAQFADAVATQTTSLLGTPAYMSPEQMRSAKSVDARTDIWALGAVIYELVTGRVPFEGDTITEIITSVLTDGVPVIEGAPAALQEIVDRCLAKSRDDRYASVREVGAALRAVNTATAAPVAAMVMTGIGTAPTIVSQSSARLDASSGQLAVQRAASRRALWFAAAAMIVVGATVVGYVMHDGGDEVAVPSDAAIAAIATDAADETDARVGSASTTSTTGTTKPPPHTTTGSTPRDAKVTDAPIDALVVVDAVVVDAVVIDAPVLDAGTPRPRPDGGRPRPDGGTRHDPSADQLADNARVQDIEVLLRSGDFRRARAVIDQMKTAPGRQAGQELYDLRADEWVTRLVLELTPSAKQGNCAMIDARLRQETNEFGRKAIADAARAQLACVPAKRPM